MSEFKWRHFEGEVILWPVCWYCRYGISYRDLEQMMGERGVPVDHSTIYRWVQKYAPEIEKRLRWQWRRPRSTSWRVDETYVKVRGKWSYLYRALDNEGNTIDFYLSPTRNAKAAKCFLGKALTGLKDWEKPEVINTDKAPTYGIAIAELEVEGKCPAEKLLEPHLGGQKDLQSISEGAEVSVRTLQRWVVEYRRAGLAGLVKKGRRDKGERRAVSSRLRDGIEGLALEKPALPLTSVHRQVKQFAQMIGEAAPSYWVVRDIALSIPNDLRTLAQQGARRYGELYDLVHRREESRPNALWQADHAQLDILLLREDGATARPWLTAIIDDHSRAIAGYYLSFDPPSSLRTSLALRQGIWRKAEPHWQICGIT